MHRLALRADRVHRKVCPVVEVNRHRRKVRAGLFEFAPFGGLHVTRAECPRINPRAADQHTAGQLLVGHLQRKDAHRNPGISSGAGEMEHYGRFAHTGPASQHDKLATPPAARQSVETPQACRKPYAFSGLHGLLSPFEVVESCPHDLRKRCNIVGVDRCGGYGGYFCCRPIQNARGIGGRPRCEFMAE